MKRQGSRFKVSPPPQGQGIWYWERIPFFIHKVCSILFAYLETWICSDPFISLSMVFSAAESYTGTYIYHTS